MARASGPEGTGGDLHGPCRVREGTARASTAVSRSDNVQGVCHPRRTTCGRGDQSRACPGRAPRVRPPSRLRGDGGRAPRLRHGEAHGGRRRPPRRGARGMRLIYEKSQEGRRASTLPERRLPVPEVPAALRRETPPRLPEISEPELVRHFTRLSTRTFGVDTGFYPLGSCTMKHNPRVNERV